MSVVTQWFEPTDEVNPIHIGVYETYWLDKNDFQFWNGEFWGLTSITPVRAYRNRGCRSAFQNPKWRGLADKPVSGAGY